MKNKCFTSYFFNVNISVTIKHSNLNFSVLILNSMREGTVSQICHIWPSFYSMHCRKYCRVKMV